MESFTEIASFLWGIADLIRDSFKRGKYQDVILPLTVLRRIDCVLAPTRLQVRETHERLRGKLENLDPALRQASGYAFYNTSRFDFAALLGDAPNLAANLRAYIAGFSENMRDVLEKFGFDNTITLLENADLLFLVMERFKQADLHPDKITNLQMGYIFEELIRRFNEALDENPGEHFTPREVIRLMVSLLLAEDTSTLHTGHLVRNIYDPCCGTGGMLTAAKERLHELNPESEVYLYGQEVNPETFAVCKSDLYMKSADGRDADNIKFGSTLAHDQFADDRFDYLLANPPYGKDWKRDQAAVLAEAAKPGGRFGAGTPRISDGQLLFLEHMLARMQPWERGGSRVAIVMNGSPLFTGDAGSGESEIRRWILEQDWLEAIIALPEQLFYNTGIATYIWVLTNHKAPARRGKVQLINATDLWTPMRRSRGEKRREIVEGQIAEIVRLFLAGEQDDARAKVFATTDFGYRKITVERPLRLNFAVSAERLARLREHPAFVALATSRKQNAQERAAEEAGGHALQARILAMLATLGATRYLSRAQFEQDLERASRAASLKLAAPVVKAITAALAERDESAEVCRDAKGRAEADPDLRDTENVPLGEDAHAYLAREVTPHVADAWLNEEKRDPQDGGVGVVGYEINFNRYFYQYTPPRPLEQIEGEIRALESEILAMLREVAG